MIKYTGLLFGAMILLSGCGGLDIERSQPLEDSEEKPWETGRFLGNNLFNFTLNRDEEETPTVAAVDGVNGYLWRASLDTVSFLPITSADPLSGLIITDWYTLPEAPQERFRLNIHIRGQTLRSNGLKVSMFRQVKTEDQWSDAPSATEAAREIEETILTTARDLRISDLQ